MADLPPDMLDIPANVIEQIPLGVQVIDLASLRASDRPQGQSLYPDSIIPVSSFTHGQHPDTGSAQTIESDGVHRLKVSANIKSSDIPLGGGGSPYKQVQSSFATGPGGYNDWQIFASHGGSDMGQMGAMNVLYAAQWSMVLESAVAGTHYDQAVLQLYPLPDQLKAIDLFAVPLAVRSTDFGSSPAAQHGTVNYGPGIDLSATFPGNAGFELWMHGGGNFTMWFTVNFFYS